MPTAIDLPVSEPFTAADNINPLHQFRSYSYQFFLIACDSTSVANYLSSSVSTNAFERTPQNLENIREVIPVDGYGKYVIILDTRHDVDIIIEDVEWETMFYGTPNSSGSAVALSVTGTEGIINFLEPRGVNFLNILARLGDQLNVDFLVMPWLLKTLFYGHTDTGEVIPLDSVQPLGFVPVDISSTVSERGTTYKMKIVGRTNGIAYNPAFNAIVDGVCFPITTGQTLAQHLATFTTQVNTTYANQREQVLAKTAGVIDLSTSATVKYDLQLQDNSKQLQYLTDFGTNITDLTQIAPGKYIIKGTAEGGFEQVISTLLTSSKRWNAIVATGDPPDETDMEGLSGRFTFKLTLDFQSTSSATSVGQVTITGTISEFEFQTVEVISTPAGTQVQTPVPKIDPKDVVVFDYIFTGKNVDIESMELNMAQGLAQLQWLSGTKSLPLQGEDVFGGPAATPSTMMAAGPSAGPFNIHGAVRKGTPIFAPFNWYAGHKKEMVSTEDTATADAIWKDFMTFYSINTKLTIAGNPNLLAKVINPNRNRPSFAQINIKMPSTPQDIWEYNLGGNTTPGGYYNPFWYTGYYNIQVVHNKFIGGKFTQELELQSFPQTSNAQGSTAATETAQQTPENVRTHFNIPTPTTPQVSNTIPTAPVTPGLNPTSSKKPGTPTTTNPSFTTDQQFVANYWNTALAAYNQTGIDPNFTLAQAAVETGWGVEKNALTFNTFFNERSFNSKYQNGFIPGTGGVNGVPKPFASYSDITNSFLDQAGTLKRIYPTSYSATDITTYANGLINGKSGPWTSTNTLAYPGSVIAAYNMIQIYKANLGIENYLVYTPGPKPAGPTPRSSLLAVATPPSPTPSTGSSTSTTYATNRTVAQAAIAQKATVFLPTSPG